MEVLPNIYSLRVDTGAFMGTYPPNVYLVKGERVALVDSGYGDEAALSARRKQLAELGVVKVEYLIITHHHTDHRAGVEVLRAATGATVLAHVLEKGLYRDDSTPIPADRWVEDEPVLDLGNLHLKLLHMPGHSPGHLCVLVQETKVLFSGDQVLGVGTTAIGQPHGDMRQHIASLERLRGLDLDIILPAHGPPIRQPQRKLQELIEHRKAREEQVRALVGRGVATVEDMLSQVYPELQPGLLDMARGQLHSHLVKLEQEGRVVARDGRYSLP